MCIVSYMHHHHVPPCQRPISYTTEYIYCSEAMLDPATAQILGPCVALCLDPQQRRSFGNACGAAGGCLVSPDCSSGACRLRDLSGRWKCCQCHRGGNITRWCQHKKRGSPDTFCYHVVCYTCTRDA
ncbi:hypothetical protein NLU13_7970 [Sarocladium strictum]|uniref:Uncharacterized protein n=1 Tax=Sarocladium strictum TaxID=5046 RepID=A0AA39GBW1_SARSR|nr:hypothetical protein NLU13_7970 [Sarocladium strictum]